MITLLQRVIECDIIDNKQLLQKTINSTEPRKHTQSSSKWRKYPSSKYANLDKFCLNSKETTDTESNGHIFI